MDGIISQINEDEEIRKVDYFISFISAIYYLQSNAFTNCYIICYITGWARFIRSHSSARFCFELSGIRINSVFKHTII